MNRYEQLHVQRREIDAELEELRRLNLAQGERHIEVLQALTRGVEGTATQEEQEEALQAWGDSLKAWRVALEPK